MPLSFSAATHIGVRREINEDSYCALPDLGLFAVADGVGGHDAGEVASSAAIDAVRRAIENTRGCTERSSWPFEYQPALGIDGNRLNWALHQANLRLRAEGAGVRGRSSMATTIAAVLFESDPAGVREPIGGATIGHVGDSRVYRWRTDRLDRLTRDHSWVEEQVRAGLITEQDAWRHPRRNLLTRALTGGLEPVSEFGWAPLKSEDALVLCSDGLSGVLTDGQIAAILTQDGQGQAGTDPGTTVCDALVHAANLAGGPDNITVIVVRVSSNQTPCPS
jgi:serine/threonine protein phosphatase PrpC